MLKTEAKAKAKSKTKQKHVTNSFTLKMFEAETCSKLANVYFTIFNVFWLLRKKNNVSVYALIYL